MSWQSLKTQTTLLTYIPLVIGDVLVLLGIRACKHTRIVTAWQKAGSPEGVVLDDTALIIGNIFEWNNI